MRFHFLCLQADTSSLNSDKIIRISPGALSLEKRMVVFPH